MLIPIFHARVFNAHGFFWDTVVETEDLNDYPTGEMLGFAPPEVAPPQAKKTLAEIEKRNLAP